MSRGNIIQFAHKLRCRFFYLFFYLSPSYAWVVLTRFVAHALCSSKWCGRFGSRAYTWRAAAVFYTKLFSTNFTTCYHNYFLLPPVAFLSTVLQLLPSSSNLSKKAICSFFFIQSSNFVVSIFVKYCYSKMFILLWTIQRSPCFLQFSPIKSSWKVNMMQNQPHQMHALSGQGQKKKIWVIMTLVEGASRPTIWAIS